MAINSFHVSCDKIPVKSSCSANSSNDDNSCRLVKINSFATEGSIPNATNKHSKPKKMISKSPYLPDRVQLLSRVTEKRMFHKKTTDFVSSFPLAVNIYKANSDEFKSHKRVNKKVKKSVLTLPNEPTPVPQICTVSDMNDSEYCEKNEHRKQKVIKRRSPILNLRKPRVREKDLEFYDRDAQYCSQLNINLDCSSTDMMKNFNGDGKRVFNKKKNVPICNNPQSASKNLNDVWAVLRNMNRFQFRPSPPMSDESIIPVKKKIQKRRTNLKDTRVIETCRTEEFAYITTGYELENNSIHSYSPSSSIDRITVIDKQNEFSKICEEFEKQLLKSHDFLKDSNNAKNKLQKGKIQCKNPRSNVRAICNVGPKEHKQLVDHKPLKKKKKAKRHVDLQCTSEPNSTGNNDSLIDDNVPITDVSEIFSLNTDNESMVPTKGSFSPSVKSGSSKTELRSVLSEQPNNKGNYLEEQLKAMPKLLNKESTAISVRPNRFDPQNRKPRLVTTMPSSCIIPKLTNTEIKRRLTNIKFPLVILGKDQVNSNIKVLNYEPPQFDGLDKHIWPFMIEWSENTRDDINNESAILKPKCNSPPILDERIRIHASKPHKANIELSANKPTTIKDKKQLYNDLNISKKKFEIKRTLPCPEIPEKLLQTSKKQKSIIQLKDKMMNFLCKKPSCRNITIENHHTDNKAKFLDITRNKRDVITDTHVRPVNVLLLSDVPKRPMFQSPVPPIAIARKSPNYPWAKGRWASEFIENIIKKIRNGVYYTQDHKDISRKYRIDLKEVSVQVGSLCDSTDSTQTYETDTEPLDEMATNTNNSGFNSIPGFNNKLPLFEIKTLNKNQIAVKHCVTNVMVQFDVTVPARIDESTVNLNKPSLIPLEVTDSQTKVYKCKTTILNAVLPAEICSIIPKMMNNLIDSNPNINIERPSSIYPSKTESYLSTISEQTRCEHTDSSCPTPPSPFIFNTHSINIPPPIKSLNTLNVPPTIKCLNNNSLSIPPSIKPSNTDFIKISPPTKPSNTDSINVPPPIKSSPELLRILQGRFTNKTVRKSKLTKNNVKYDYNSNNNSVIELFPQVNLKDLLRYEVSPLKVELDNIKYVQSLLRSKEQISTVPETQSQTCTSLKMFSGNNRRINSTFNPFNLVGMIESMLQRYNLQINLNLSSYFDMLRMQYDGKNIVINLSMKDCFGIRKNMSVTVSNLKIDSLYKAIPKTKSTKKNKAPVKCIEYINTSLARESEHTEMNQVIGNKVKRKSLYKFHRKCKSTTNIPPIEKCQNIPLNKVTTLDDFFQILGSKKSLCSVFDGYSAKKILSSIMEMKNWITEINAKQALLILLLTNKKDTPNLVRFRPILLQGIAVNRITRASELDMEIEVIERENLNKFSQYEGISYLPESATNYDNLMEELYWIAKTTASDYQRPFDESSERLLKSLLEKRKKLNPSYLRVMARYVGLGLLKSPTKC